MRYSLSGTQSRRVGSDLKYKLLVCRSHHEIVNVYSDGDLSASYHLVEDAYISRVGSEAMPGESAGNLLVPQLGTLDTAVYGFIELND